MKLFLLSILTLILFSSCSQKVDKEQLVGKYVSNTHPDIIELKSDFTYLHSLKGKDTTYLDSGTWKLDESGNNIIFKNFTFFDDIPPGNWYSKIKIDDGIKLMYSSEDNVFYKKTNP